MWPALLALLGRAGAAVGIRAAGAEVAAGTAARAAAGAEAAQPIATSGFGATLRSGVRSATKLFGDVRQDGFNLTLAKRWQAREPAQQVHPETKPGAAMPPAGGERGKLNPSKFIDYGALMANMGQPKAMADAEAKAKLDAAGDAAERESIRREMDAAKAAEALASSLGKVQKVTGVIGGVMIGSYLGLRKLSSFAEEKERGVGIYSGAVMGQLARLNVQDIQLGIQRARATEQTGKGLLKAVYDFRQASRPLENAFENTTNFIETFLLKTGTAALNVGHGAYNFGYRFGEWMIGKKPADPKQPASVNKLFNELISGQRSDGRGSFHADGNALPPPPNWQRNHF